MTTLTPGQEIGPYRVIEQVGKGGMATVYKAHHAAMDRYVAIKILPFQFAQNQEFNDRFRREVRVIAKLEHPRILPVYDSGEHEGTPYLIMRYLDAGTLKERIEAGKMPLHEVDRIFTQLVDALSYAHSHEIIHRDIKPSNVMLTRRGDVFLTDFGIAKLIGEHTQFTASGAITGTPAYMSPEQAEGRPIDARADIYALGIVLYEMVTGRVPYEAETPLAVILKHLQSPLPPPSSITEIHPAVEQVILKALAKSREDRYATTEELLIAWKNAIQQAQSEKDTLAGTPPAGPTLVAQPAASPVPTPTGVAVPPQPAKPTPSPKKRSPWFWVGGGLAALALLTGCVFGAFSIYRVCCAPPGPDNPPPGQTSGDGNPPEESLPPGSSLPAPVEGEGEWESWTGAGVVFTVVYSNGQVLAGGLGGISVYNEDWDFVRQITVQDGLPDNWVYYLFLDEEGDGDLWAGTANGLVRFNGEEWVTYGYEDGLDDTTINFVGRVEDSIIAGTGYGPDGGGINFFDGSSWKQPNNFDSTSEEDPNRFDNSVWGIVYDENTGLIWFATENGLGAYDGNAFTRYTTDDGLPDNFINGLTIFEDGMLIITTESGAGYYDGESFQVFEPTRGYTINDAVVDSEGRYWFPGGSGVWRYSPESGNWDLFEGGVDFPEYTSYRAVADADNNVFFGTDGEGVVVFDGEDFFILDRPAGPLATAYWGILENPEGSLWFSEEYGLTIDAYNSANDEWENIELDVCCVIPFAFDAEGNLWGGGDTGLWIIAPDGNATNITTEHGLPSNQVYHLSFAGDGTTWLATDSGLVQMNGFEVTQVLRAADIGLESDWTRILLAASDGSLWVGREGGLSHLTPDGTWE
ncbi:MAG TPA: protein kinase, partial [Anaerolineales bacterium]|nr:protein kinase [Anaerolineales bacterium]